MLILLDIGNTAVTYGIIEGKKVKESGFFIFNDSIPLFVKKWSKSGGKSIVNIVISCVVPKNILKLKKIADKYPHLRLWIAGKDLSIPIRCQYRKGQLGIDRLVTAYGASLFHKLPCLVIDFGTAITFDYVSRQGIFKGGMIIPGPEVSFQAMLQRAALLPKKARLPKKSVSYLGKSTYDCMTSGILQGYGAMTDGLIQRFKERLGSMSVVGTGGFAEHLKPYAKCLKVTDPTLSIRALAALFSHHRQKPA